MRKISWAVLLCLLITSTVVIASSNTDAEYLKDVFTTREMSDSLHDAMAILPRVLHEQKRQQEEGADLTEKEQQLLDIWQEKSKGLKVVLVGFENCRPCLELYNLLDTETDTKCWIERTEEQGVEFYMLNFYKEFQEREYTEENLIRIWNVTSIPALLIIKDGLPVARLNGYNRNKSEEILQILDKEIAKNK